VYEGGSYMFNIWQTIGLGVLFAAVILVIASFVMMLSKKPGSDQDTTAE